MRWGSRDPRRFCLRAKSRRAPGGKVKANVRRGRFAATREGYGFVTPDEGGPDVYIPEEETAGALHRDMVEYEVLRPAEGTWRASGAVLRVIERGFRTLTGVVEGTRKRPYLVPDHPLLPKRMRLVGNLREIEPGQRILCSLHDAGRARAGAMVVRVLGDADDPRLDEEIIVSEFGLPGEYPDGAVAEAEARREVLAAAGLAGRTDFSREDVLTIDPLDARDFDDAVSLRRDPRGFWLLRVHIADVSEAVLPDTALDREARRRGNSTYLPGRMIPMLPESLATDLMSLAPGVPKRVVSITARLSDDGEIRGTRAEEGWIVSRHRLEYGFVQTVLDGKTSGDPHLDARLREMDLVAQTLRARRFSRGGFNLVVPEIEVALDERGLPLDIKRRETGRSNQIIEEFMILANRVACSYARRPGHPYLYRVHDSPDPIALAEFAQDVRTLAPEVRAQDLADLASIRHWLAALPSEPRTWRIHSFFLRSMQRAVYAHVDRGHFGLGLRGYGHFTSPIRRYPDLFNHRVVKWTIRNGSRPVPDEWRDAAVELGDECSGTEERSERAERELVRLKSLRWAEQRLGDSFRGTVAAVLPAGYVIELDVVPIEGFVPRVEAEAVVPYVDRATTIGPGRGGLQVMDPVIVQIGRVERRERRLQFTIRAAGRRALATDPDKLEPLVDAWEQIRGGRARSSARARRKREKEIRAQARREAAEREGRRTRKGRAGRRAHATTRGGQERGGHAPLGRSTRAIARGKTSQGKRRDRRHRP